MQRSRSARRRRRAGSFFKPSYSCYKKAYKKAGVTFLDLVSAAKVHGALFDQPDNARSVNRMKAIDALNTRYGRSIIAIGTAGERQTWSLRREFISPRYPTVWDELPRV